MTISLRDDEKRLAQYNNCNYIVHEVVCHFLDQVYALSQMKSI